VGKRCGCASNVDVGPAVAAALASQLPGAITGVGLVTTAQMTAAIAAAVAAGVAASASPAGMTVDFAGVVPPPGWLMCDGSAISRAAFPGLFAAIGTVHNIGGEASTDFRLPDKRGRTSVGAGAGAGLTPRALGAATGSENTPVVVHTHTGSTGIESVAHTHGTLMVAQNAALSGSGTLNAVVGSLAAGILTGTESANHAHTVGISTDGASGVGANMMPTVVLNSIIKT
jgi:microcystin-dependent protein